MIQSAYNLCDMDIRFFEENESVRKDLKRLADLGTEHIYAGSGFCVNYFLHWCRFAEDLIQMVHENGMTFCAVVPVPSDRTFPALMESLIKLDPFTDELTVNDYGMLVSCAEKLSSPLILGRLFMRQARDPRYPELMAATIRIPFSAETLERFRIDYHVKGIEMEAFGLAIDAKELPEDMIFCLHRPWYMMSCDFICEDAASSLPIEKKFRPDAACHLECCDVSHIYPLQNSRVIKIGRGIYAYQEADPVCTLSERNILRYIEFYPYTEGVPV